MNAPFKLELEPQRLSTPLALLLVALSYFASGRLGLLLAIPPGYATAVWPASGIALAAVILRGYGMLPGVWLGSFAINLFNSRVFDASSIEALLRSLPLPALIACGAAAQAGLGGWLVRRFVGYRNVLEQELQVVTMLALGGPLACLISSGVGVGSLWLQHLIPAESALFNWWTWWVGDTIGVLIFTPLVLVWSLRPFGKWMRRQLQATLPLAALFAGVVWLFVFMSGREQTRVQAQFDDWVHDTSAQLRYAIDHRLEALYSLQGLYASSDGVTRAEFSTFAARQLERREGVLGLSWNQLVSAAQLADFNQRFAAEYGPDRAAFELDSSGARQPVAAREQYLPVLFTVPQQENAPVLGFDVLSEARRREAAWRARDSGLLIATAPLPLVQGPEGGAGVVFFAPVYRNGAPTDTLERRRQNLTGFAAAAVQPAKLIPMARAGSEGEAVEIRVIDITGEPAVLLYQSPHSADVAGLAASHDMQVGGRRWRVEFSLPQQYLVANRSWEVWMLLAAGMLFTGLLGTFLLVAIGRESRVAHLVDERTAQLQDANRSLAREAARSDRFETEARARADQISATNRELEQFAFVVSHDLQAPLRNILSFSKLLEKRHGATLADEAKEYLEYLRGSAGDMGRLIEDLLQLSRVNPKRAHMGRVRAGDALAAALGNLRIDLETREARVEQTELPEVFGDVGLLTQLFQNLIANAIKFQRAGVAPRVRVGVELKRGEWHFSVADNGIGISEKNIGRLFQIFKRLHTAEEYPGTGIGLALCKKIVELHGGRIWLESKLGEGTTFYFALPLQAPAPVEPLEAVSK